MIMKEYNKGLIVVANVKKKVHSSGAKVSISALIELEKKVDKILDDAVNRAFSNGRKTLKQDDI